MQYLRNVFVDVGLVKMSTVCSNDDDEMWDEYKIIEKTVFTLYEILLNDT